MIQGDWVELRVNGVFQDIGRVFFDESHVVVTGINGLVEVINPTITFGNIPVLEVQNVPTKETYIRRTS